MSRSRLNITKEWLYDEYINKKKTIKEISEESDFSNGSIHRYLELYNIPTRKNKGETHPNWKGGRWKSSGGYWYVRCPNHPRADNRGYVRENILKPEEKFGREIENDEDVHHIDYNKENNTFDNLDIINHKDHHKTTKSLQKLVPELLKQGVIEYKNGKYKFK